MSGSKRVRVRRLEPDDIPALVALQAAVYDDYPESAQYDARNYELQHAAFPEGQLVAFVGDELVGYATSLIIQLDDAPHVYDYNELTGSGTFSTHTPGGDTLYGADIGVHPEWRGRGVSGRLYDKRKALMRRYNLRRMVAYGRLTGYPAHAGRLTPEEYVEQVIAGELKDRALSAHLKAGYRVLHVGMNLMRDEASLNAATLLELPNPKFDPQKRRIAAAPISRPARKARVCAAQYRFQAVGSLEEFLHSVSFFVDAANEYHAHFLVFPEYFTAALFDLAPPELAPAEAFRWVAALEPQLLAYLVEAAKEHGLFIVGGSTPSIAEDGSARNVCHFVTPSGASYAQEKLHVTPFERRQWGVRGGEVMRVFETPFGRVAIQICYDVEFPEATRMLALAGAELVFVPFSTDEVKAYHRVRYCAQARAIENGIFLALAGNAGSLQVRNYLLNYARSAILTPSDFGFPDEAVAAEADPNVETVVIADVDFTNLARHRRDGSTRPLTDRRLDLYELAGKRRVELVRVD